MSDKNLMNLQKFDFIKRNFKVFRRYLMFITKFFEYILGVMIPAPIIEDPVV